MNLEKYDFKGKFEDKGDKKVSYIFVSIGIKGNILKGVYFQPQK